MKVKQNVLVMGRRCSSEAVFLSAINKATAELFTAVTLHKPGPSQAEERCERTPMCVLVCVHTNELWLVWAQWGSVGLSVAILWLKTAKATRLYQQPPSTCNLEVDQWGKKKAGYRRWCR